MSKEEKINVPTFLKWAGGKQQLLNQFSKKFPNQINHYVEPFVGGGSVLFYVLKYKNPTRVEAYDGNEELINTYIQVRDNPDKLIKLLKKLECDHNRSKNPKSFFYRKREEFNTIKRDKTKKASLFIYLNKTCFNGLYRVNSLGEFNVPFNGEKRTRLFEESELMEASQLLKNNVCLEKRDFRKVFLSKIKRLFYFDPPYWSEATNGFISYTNPVFGKDAQEELAKGCVALSEKGHSLILSNSNTEFVKKLYRHPSFTIHDDIEARRMINCNGDGRHVVSELLITANV